MGKLTYLSHIRLDIAYKVGVVSQFMHDLQQEHLNDVYMILWYLKVIPRKGTLFKKDKELTMKFYTNEAYTGSLVDRRSITCYFMFLGGNLMTWRSNK